MREIRRAYGYSYLTKSVYEAAMRGEPCDKFNAYFDGESSLYLRGCWWNVEYADDDLADERGTTSNVFLLKIDLGKCPAMDIDRARVEARKALLDVAASYANEADKIVVGSELKG